MIEHPSILLAGIAARAGLAADRKRKLQARPPLSAHRAAPIGADRTEASGGHPLSRSSQLPRGSVVEADRPANPSTPGASCGCRVCNSDLADIVPCERRNQ